MDTSTPASGPTPDPQPVDASVAGADKHGKNAPKTLTCPVCATTFSRRANGGKCPVCGEQVMAPDEAATAVPVISPLSKSLFQEGNWRPVAVMALVIYEIALAILLWMHLSHIHAL